MVEAMKIAVLGTGIVGRTLGSRLVELGHEVIMGSRSAVNLAAVQWREHLSTPSRATIGTFAQAAARGDVVLNATAGVASVDALVLAGTDNLAGKIIIDVANPLTFESGAPALSVCNTDSLGEQIQRAFPRSTVVKTLNTVNCEVMVHPERLSGPHTMFVAGDDPEAKVTAADLLHGFGWKHILDIGGIEASRGLEMYVALWIHLRQAQDTNQFNIQVVTG
jgi:8-hydroxy-5-deazaflavin:NADPH oxidoreductase